jgi:hypothetical protein
MPSWNDLQFARAGATRGESPQERRHVRTRQQAAQRMKPPRRKAATNARHLALEIIAAHPNGCTEGTLTAHNIPADVLMGLVQSGLVMSRVEHVDEEDGILEVTTLWITSAGEVVLAARGTRRPTETRYNGRAAGRRACVCVNAGTLYSQSGRIGPLLQGVRLTHGGRRSSSAFQTRTNFCLPQLG